MTSINGDIIDWDEQLESISGIEKTEARMLVHDFFPSLNTDEFSRIIQQLDDNNSCELTTYIETSFAGKLPVNLNFYRSKEGKADIIILCNRIKLDSAIVKQTDKKIAPPKEEFEDFPQPMCRIDSEGILIFANRELLTLLGFRETEYLINNIFDFLVDEAYGLNRFGMSQPMWAPPGGVESVLGGPSGTAFTALAAAQLKTPDLSKATYNTGANMANYGSFGG